VRACWLGLAALLAAVPGISGCGGVGNADVSEAAGSQLAIYSSLPLQGPYAAASQQIVGGEKLALADASGRAGRFKIGYVSLDDANPANGQLSPGKAEVNAKTAAQDTSTIAYLGDYNSAATAVSLPLINAAGILQVSPASPYVGLTSSLDAGQDEPERFYPSGRRTFGRLAPGDPVQAAAQVLLMKSLGVHSVYVLDDQDPFEIPLAQIVAGDATRAGITVLAHDSLATTPGATFTGEIEKIVESGAQAVFLAGDAGVGTAALWRQLHNADPRLLLLGSSEMVSESFTGHIGTAAESTYLTTPLLAVGQYPVSAQHVLKEYRRIFGSEAGPEALYGYEAMTVVLDAIRDAGVHGNDRQTVIEQFLGTRNRDSVIGRYSIEANGESTVSRYGVDRVQNGRPVFFRTIEVSRPPTN
jgi:branched-chain amino acid transport system substrate-binding protein